MISGVIGRVIDIGDFLIPWGGGDQAEITVAAAAFRALHCGDFGQRAHVFLRTLADAREQVALQKHRNSLPPAGSMSDVRMYGSSLPPVGSMSDVCMAHRFRLDDVCAYKTLYPESYVILPAGEFHEAANSFTPQEHLSGPQEHLFIFFF